MKVTEADENSLPDTACVLALSGWQTELLEDMMNCVEWFNTVVLNLGVGIK